MPLYEYQGQQYDIATDDAAEAKAKILKHLGTSESIPKRDTTYGEDFQIGLGQAASTAAKGVGLLAGGAAGLFDEDLRDKIFKGTEDIAKETQDYWTPKDAEQSFGGKVASMVSTLPAQLLAMPFSPADTGMSMINHGESVENAQMGTLIDTLGNVVGAKLPASVGGNLLTKMTTGAGANVVQDYLTRKGIQAAGETEATKQQFEPTAETIALSGILGAGIGAVAPTTHIKSKQPEVNPTPVRDSSDSLNQYVEQLRNDRESVQQTIDSIASKENPTEKQLRALEAMQEKLHQIETDLTTLTKAEPTTSKRTPMEVAEEKIAEVGDDVQLAQKRIVEVEQKLKDPNISEGQRGALEVERQVYQELGGEQPVVKQEGVTLEDLARQDQAMREGFEANQPKPATESEIRAMPDSVYSPDAVKSPYNIDETIGRDFTPEEIDALGGIQKGEDFFDSQRKAGDLSPKQAHATAKYNLTSLDNSLRKLNEKIANYESGKTPSGTVEIAKLLEQRKKLEYLVDKWEGVREATKPVEQKIADRVIPREPAKVSSTMKRLSTGLKMSPEFSKAIERGDVLGALKLFADGAALRPELKAVAEALMSKTFLNERKIALVKGLKSLGQADWKGNILLKSSQDAVVFLHEVIHTVTMGRIEAYRQGKSYGSKSDAALKSLFTLYADIKNNHLSKLVDTVGEERAMQLMKNEDEFLSYGLMNNGFQAWLNTIPYKKSTGLSALVNKLSDFFGWNKQQTTALQKLFEVSDKLIAQSKGELDINGKPLEMRDVPDSDVSGTFWNKVGINAFTAQAHIMYKNNPVIQQVHSIIKDANRVMDYRYNAINGGTNTRGAYGRSTKYFLTTRKLSEKDGWAYTRIHTKPEEAARVLDAFQEGYVNGRSYDETLDLYRGSWNEAETNFFNTVVRTQQLLFKYENELRRELGLRPLRYKTGHFPAIRVGEHHVIFSQDGVTYHLESFISKAEADKFLASERANGNLNASYLDNKLTGKTYDDILSVLEDVDEALGRGRDGVAEARDKLIAGQAMSTSAAMRRSGVPGYIGSEIGLDARVTGNRFLENYDGYIKQRLEGIRSREIIYKKTKFYEEDPSAAQMPNAQKLADVMVESQTGQIRGPEWLQGMATWLKEVVDKGANKALNMDKRSTHILDRFLGVTSHIFYAHNITMKPAIWIAQVSQYLNGLRGLPDHNISPMAGTIATGKTFATLVRGKYVDADMKNAIMWASQNTNSLHPQLRNELNNLHVGTDPNSYVNKVIDLVSGETFAGAADSFSRFATFITYYHALKDQGLSGVDLYRKAADITDDNMFMYGKREQPAMYKHLGIVGEQMTPLKTFAHGQAGLIVADMKNFIQSPSIRTAGPLALTALVTSLMGGLISAPIVAEYEALRRILVAMKIISEDSFPSVTEIFLKMPPSVAYGPVSGATGIDIGASMRYNSLLGGLVTSHDVVNQIFPALGFTSGLAVTAGKKAMGHLSGDMPEAESNFLRNKLAPKGYVAGLVDLPAANERSMVPFGPRGEGLVEQTDTEKVAKMLGSRSIAEVRASSEYLLQQEKKKKRSEKIGKGVDFILQGDTEKGIERLVEAQVNPKTIKNLLQNQMLKQQRPVLDRFVTDKSGNISSYEQKRRMLDMIEYFEAGQE